MTKQRQIVLDIVKNSMVHLSAEEIYIKAKELLPSISRGTVYRNLGILNDEKMVKRLTTPLGVDVYDKTHDPHGHIICPVCGKITDYDSHKVTKLLDEDFCGFVDSYELTIKMKCKQCI